ncbi:hypothetical protein LGN12_31025, partial [Burkholderia multivorans]|nr:hypothetical protein [Burkholderia multivorans]
GLDTLDGLDDLTVRESRLLHAVELLNEKILLLTTSLFREDYRPTWPSNESYAKPTLSLALLDVVLILVLAFPSAIGPASISLVMAARTVLLSVLPIAVLLLSSLVPPSVKAMLVYWRYRNPLPGHEAFTKYGLHDTRIDVEALRRNVGQFPTEPSEQNAFWYKLYKRVENEASVTEAHKMYLLWRDATVVSLPLAIGVPALLKWNGANNEAAATACAIFVVQFLLTAVAARHSGIRFVCNVMAVHSAKRITAPPRKTVAS